MKDGARIGTAIWGIDSNHSYKSCLEREWCLVQWSELCHRKGVIDALEFSTGGEGGEISPESLEKLNRLMEEGPGEEASEEEIAAFMKKAMAIEGAPELIAQFEEQLRSGVLSDMLKVEAENEPFAQLKSPLRVIYRVGEVRLSLPSDASFFELHAALTEALSLDGKEDHRFELREGGEVEVVFGSGAGQYPEREHLVSDMIEAGVTDFYYLHGDEYFVVIEDLVAAGFKGTSLAMTPHLHDES